MKLPANALLLFPWISLRLAAADPIQSVPLDDRVVVTVPVATNRVTTLSFPGPITAIDAAGVTSQPEAPGFFQLAHAKGASFCAVRALRPGASANLNIRWDRHTYVFELIESPTPVLALNMTTRPTAPLIHPAPRPTATRLMALLDKAKAFPLLKTQQPAAVAGVEARTFKDNESITDYGDFVLRLIEAYRFNAEDTLVFRITIQNRNEQPLEYEPGSFTLRAGNRLYSQSISDATGLVGGKSECEAYFAVTGTPDGARNELSLKNDFQIGVTRVSPRPAVDAEVGE